MESKIHGLIEEVLGDVADLESSLREIQDVNTEELANERYSPWKKRKCAKCGKDWWSSFEKGILLYNCPMCVQDTLAEIVSLASE